MRISAPLRLERRIDAPRWLVAAVPFTSIALAGLIAAGVLLVTGNNPADTYRQILDSAFFDPGALNSTLVSATPLILTGLSAAVAFRVKIWNIGGEGQLYVGAMFAVGVGIALGDVNAAVAVPVMAAAGAIGGALWAVIPAVLRVFANTNEVITSFMLNLVAGLLIYYLVFGSGSYWRDLSTPAALNFPQGKPIADSAFWPQFTGSSLIVPTGLLLGAILAVGLHVLLRRTRFGFEMNVVADSPSAGRYAGMRTRRLVIVVMVLSGALAGLAGASQMGDFTHALEPKGLQAAQYAYTGIVVAALARYSPLAVIPAAIFLGGLSNAGFALQGPGFPQGLVGTMEGILLFCVIGGEVFLRFRVRSRAWSATEEKAGAEADAVADPDPGEVAAGRSA